MKCNMVGVGIYLRQYMADRKISTAIKEAETDWMARNAKFLPSKNKEHTPRRVLTRYCEAMNCDEDTVDWQLDWEFFAPDDSSSEE